MVNSIFSVQFHKHLLSMLYKRNQPHTKANSYLLGRIQQVALLLYYFTCGCLSYWRALCFSFLICKMGMIITVLILKEKIRLDKMTCIKFFKKSWCGKCLINCISQEFSTEKKKQTKKKHKPTGNTPPTIFLGPCFAFYFRYCSWTVESASSHHLSNFEKHLQNHTALSRWHKPHKKTNK